MALHILLGKEAILPHNHASGADGLKIAVHRKGRARLVSIEAAAYLNRYSRHDVA